MAYSIQDIIDQEKGPIWVRNTASEIVSPGGDIYISVSISGTARVVTVPSTWVPINITNQVPRKALTESPYFMEALTKGLVRAISETEAAKILARDGAQEEIERLAERARSVKEAVTVKTLNKNVTVVNSNIDEEDEAVATAAASKLKKGVSVVKLNDPDEEDEEEEDVSASFKGWTMKLNSMTPKECGAAIKLRGAISHDEAVFLVSKLKHKTIAAKISAKLNLD